MLTKSEITRIINHFGEGRFDSVLEKLGERVFDTTPEITPDRIGYRMLALWMKCGAKPLQQIVDESGWEKDKAGEKYNLKYYEEYLKSPEANSLFTFLNTLIPTK